MSALLGLMLVLAIAIPAYARTVVLDPDWHYNQGVEQLQESDFFQAKLSFERAYLLRPSDDQIQSALSFASEQLGVTNIFTQESSVLTGVPVQGATYIGAGIFAAGVLLLSLALYWGVSAGTKRQATLGLSRISGLLLMFFGMLVLLAAFARYMQLFDARLMILSADTEYFLRPGETTPEGTLSKGGVVRVDKRHKNQALVQAQTDAFYWIDTNVLMPIWNESQ